MIIWFVAFQNWLKLHLYLINLRFPPDTCTASISTEESKLNPGKFLVLTILRDVNTLGFPQRLLSGDLSGTSGFLRKHINWPLDLELIPSVSRLKTIQSQLRPRHWYFYKQYSDGTIFQLKYKLKMSAVPE